MIYYKQPVSNFYDQNYFKIKKYLVSNMFHKFLNTSKIFFKMLTHFDLQLFFS